MFEPFHLSSKKAADETVDLLLQRVGRLRANHEFHPRRQDGHQHGLFLLERLSVDTTEVLPADCIDKRCSLYEKHDGLRNKTSKTAKNMVERLKREWILLCHCEIV